MFTKYGDLPNMVIDVFTNYGDIFTKYGDRNNLHVSSGSVFLMTS